MQNVSEDENAEAAPDIEEEAIVINMDLGIARDSHAGLDDVLEDILEKENAEIVPDIDEEAIFIDMDFGIDRDSHAISIISSGEL